MLCFERFFNASRAALFENATHEPYRQTEVRWTATESELDFDWNCFNHLKCERAPGGGSLQRLVRSLTAFHYEFSLICEPSVQGNAGPRSC